MEDVSYFLLFGCTRYLRKYFSKEHFLLKIAESDFLKKPREVIFWNQKKSGATNPVFSFKALKTLPRKSLLFQDNATEHKKVCVDDDCCTLP